MIELFHPHESPYLQAAAAQGGARPWCDMLAAASNPQPAFAWQLANESAPLRCMSLGKKQSTLACRARAPYRAGCDHYMSYGRGLHRREASLLRCETVRGGGGATCQLWPPTLSRLLHGLCAAPVRAAGAAAVAARRERLFSRHAARVRDSERREIDTNCPFINNILLFMLSHNKTRLGKFTGCEWN